MSRLSYLHNPPTAPHQYKTINDVIRKNAETMADKEAFIFYPADGPRQSLTHKELYDRARRVAQYLVATGVNRQDKVGLFGPNSLARIVAEYGILLAGGVALQFTIDVNQANDAVVILDKAGCNLVFVDPGIDGSLLPSIRSLESTEELNSRNRHYIFLRKSKMEKFAHAFIDTLDTPHGDAGALPTVYPEDEAIIFTTSGSTGKPKMVVHCHFNLTNTIALLEDDMFMTMIKWYNDRPFCWMGGSPILATSSGMTLVSTDTSVAMTGKDVGGIWKIMSEEKVNMATLMPYCIQDLINEMDNIADDGHRLDTIMTGGQIIDNVCVQVVGRFCKNLLIGYGCTEAFGVAVYPNICLGDTIATGNVGKLAAGVEIRIVDKDGHPTPLGEEGEIQMRSPFLMKGYLGDAAMNDAVFTADRPSWFKTGDVGLLTSSDELVVRGRIKENISRGTRKILPGAVDDVIQKMDGVRVVATVAVPDPRLYEEICVCYVASDGVDLQPADLEKFCEQVFFTGNLGDGMGFKPKYFVRFDNFPLSHTGKVDKPRLQREATERLQLA